MSTRHCNDDSGALRFPCTDDTLMWDLWLSHHKLPTVSVALHLKVFSHLDKQPSTIDETSAALQLGRRSVRALLTMLAAMDLLSVNGGVYSLKAVAREFLANSESDFFWGPIVSGGSTADTMPEYTRRLLLAVERDTCAVQTLTDAWESGDIELPLAQRITRVMHAHSMGAAIGCAEASSVWNNVNRVLDVAGGSGCFSWALTSRWPTMHCTVLELDAVAQCAREYAAEKGYGERVDIVAGNMFRQEWPTGFDVHFLSNIFHDWSLESCTDLARRSFRALPSGGKLVLHEALLNDALDGPVTVAAFSLHMLCVCKGQQFTLSELRTLLADVGFTDVRSTPTYSYYSLVVAVKP